MTILNNKKTAAYFLVIAIAFLFLTISLPNLAANLGISTAVATKIINIIDTYSNIATIVSLIGVILGYGVVSTALVATAKKLISKYGKGYAATW